MEYACYVEHSCMINNYVHMITLNHYVCTLYELNHALTPDIRLVE